jgi:hypothetical protein
MYSNILLCDEKRSETKILVEMEDFDIDTTFATVRQYYFFSFFFLSLIFYQHQHQQQQ